MVLYAWAGWLDTKSLFKEKYKVFEFFCQMWLQCKTLKNCWSPHHKPRLSLLWNSFLLIAPRCLSWKSWLETHLYILLCNLNTVALLTDSVSRLPWCRGRWRLRRHETAQGKVQSFSVVRPDHRGNAFVHPVFQCLQLCQTVRAGQQSSSVACTGLCHHVTTAQWTKQFCLILYLSVDSISQWSQCLIHEIYHLIEPKTRGNV